MKYYNLARLVFDTSFPSDFCETSFILFKLHIFVFCFEYSAGIGFSPETVVLKNNHHFETPIILMMGLIIYITCIVYVCIYLCII